MATDEEETGSHAAPPPEEPNLITDGRPPPAPPWPDVPGPPPARAETAPPPPPAPAPPPDPAPSPGAAPAGPDAAAGPFPTVTDRTAASPSWPPMPGGGQPGGGPYGSAPLQSTYNTMGLGATTSIEGYRQKHVGRGCFIFLVVLTLAALVGGFVLYGIYTGHESVSNLRVGTCIAGVKEGATTVRRISCDGAHQAEVAAKVEGSITMAHCTTSVRDYLAGHKVPEGVVLQLRLVHKPDQTDAQATKGYCLLVHADGSDLTGKIGP